MSDICPICQNSYWKITKDGAVRCECFERAMAQQRFESSGITKAIASMTFENYKAENQYQKIAKGTAYKYVKDFPEIRENKNNSIIFMGNSGSGKTHLTMAISNKILNDYSTGVRYMQYREAMTALKQVVNDQYDYQREKDKWQKPSVLLIDDLYKGKLTESDVNIMFEIINYRWLNNLPMIVSTEMTIDEMLNVDEATGSRLLEMAKGRLVQFPRSREMNYRL